MKFFIIFIYLITTSYSFAIEKPDIANITINKNPKTYDEVVFKDVNQKDINLVNYKGKLLILNFWATWCAPCREEMPSLDLLQLNSKFRNLKVFTINIGQEDLSKSVSFFKELKIKNLDVYYDSSPTLAKKFLLRGIPTTILIDKEGREFARITGSINFNDEKFINWLNFYD